MFVAVKKKWWVSDLRKIAQAQGDLTGKELGHLARLEGYAPTEAQLAPFQAQQRGEGLKGFLGDSDEVFGAIYKLLRINVVYWVFIINLLTFY